MKVGLWTRWAAMHGVPRVVMRARALGGDPLAQLLAGHGRGIDPYPLYDRVRAHGPLMRTPFTWATADHALCREILRDNSLASSHRPS
jgi:cytochrome P450